MGAGGAQGPGWTWLGVRPVANTRTTLFDTSYYSYSLPSRDSGQVLRLGFGLRAMGNWGGEWGYGDSLQFSSFDKKFTFEDLSNSVHFLNFEIRLQLMILYRIVCTYGV